MNTKLKKWSRIILTKLTSLNSNCPACSNDRRCPKKNGWERTEKNHNQFWKSWRIEKQPFLLNSYTSIRWSICFMLWLQDSHYYDHHMIQTFNCFGFDIDFFGSHNGFVQFVKPVIKESFYKLSRLLFKYQRVCKKPFDEPNAGNVISSVKRNRFFAGNKRRLTNGRNCASQNTCANWILVIKMNKYNWFLKRPRYYKNYWLNNSNRK